MRRPLAILLFLVLSQNLSAAEFGGYVALTTDYVKRGVSQSDGNPAIQAGADVSFPSGFFLGAWGSTTDIDNGSGRQRDLEINYYAGYVFEATESLQISANAVAYEYPGQSGGVDYSYQEYSLGANHNDRLWLELSYSPDLYHSGQSVTNVDLFSEWPLNGIWAIGGGVGYYDTSKFSGSAYQYLQLGITGSFRWFDMDLRIYDTNKWVRVVSSPDRAKARVVLKIQIPF